MTPCGHSIALRLVPEIFTRTLRSRVGKIHRDSRTSIGLGNTSHDEEETFVRQEQKNVLGLC